MDDRFSNLDISDDWKKVFEAVNQKCIAGQWWKNKPAFNNSSKKSKKKISNTILNIKIFMLGTFLGPVYYLFKGMWLKAILYTVILIFACDLVSKYSPISEPYYLLSVVWGALLPYDYYRYIVLGKQL